MDSRISKNITPEAVETEETKTNRYKSTFDEKNYLNLKLAKTQDKKETRFRLLPVDKYTSSPFKTVYMHTVELSPEFVSEFHLKSKWKSYVCLSKTDDIDHDTLGNKCPFCEMHAIAGKKIEEAKKLTDELEREAELERWREIYKKTKAEEFCIMRGIERSDEEHGPKFWMSKVRTDGKGPKTIIKELYKSRKQESIDEAKDENGGELPEDFVPENILDVETGKDLKITVTRDYTTDGKPTDKTSVSIVDYGKNKPISTDYDQIEEWIDDDKVWSDVFVAKPYEYLALILEGDIPFYDKTTGKWVAKKKKAESEDTDEQDEQAAKEDEIDEKIAVAEKKAKNVKVEDVEEPDEPETDDDDEEELPF